MDNEIKTRIINEVLTLLPNNYSIPSSKDWKWIEDDKGIEVEVKINHWMNGDFWLRYNFNKNGEKDAR